MLVLHRDDRLRREILQQSNLSADGGYAHHGAAKAATAHYTRYLAQVLGPFDITANCIAPDVIATGRIMLTVIPGRQAPRSTPPKD
jgi:NAD(P)-dependent dehydrogenase (short-subunit alcohol dehydrogenase family)